jgi:ribosome-associated protein
VTQTRPNADPRGDGADEAPSRTARKKASRALQALGERLVELRPAELAALPLPDTLHEAVLDAKRIKTFGARRRQAQYIGKLMRRLDAETVEILHTALAEP